MASSTSGFILTDKFSPFEIVKGLREILSKRPSNHGIKHLKPIASVRLEVEIDANNYLVARFLDGDDKRQLYIFFYGEDNDLNDVHEGSKIVFSLGDWGKSEEIIKACLDYFQGDNIAYYRYTSLTEDYKRYERSAS